jgi:hypothetical protein
MQFRVWRTYPDSSGNPPCEGAKKVDDSMLWAIEINTLEDLLAFSRKHGEIIVGSNPKVHENPTIEIYDYYRE